MEFFLLKLIGEWLSVLAVSVISFFGVATYQEQHHTLENTSYASVVTNVNEVVPYQTEFVFNDEIPFGSGSNVIVEGKEGLAFINSDGTRRFIREPVNRVVEIGIARQFEFTGRMTSYGGDCRGCSQTATVSCRTREGRRHSLFYDGIYYNDRDFGRARVMAADLGGFPCGTIILVDNGRVEPFLTVILDTGFTMRQQFAQGHIWMDLAFQYERDIRQNYVYGRDVKFSVQRWGW